MRRGRVPAAVAAVVTIIGLGRDAAGLESCSDGVCGASTGTDCQQPCTRALNWLDILPRGTMPEPRAFHAATDLHAGAGLVNTTFVVHGGARRAGGWANLRLGTLGDSYLYDTTLQSWHRLGIQNGSSGVLRRAAHQMVALECPLGISPGSVCLYMYGGYASDESMPCASGVQYFDDLVVVGPVNSQTPITEWRILSVQPPANSARAPGALYGYGHAALGGNFTIVGGFSGDPEIDRVSPLRVRQYRPATHEWMEFTPVNPQAAAALPPAAFAAAHPLPVFPNVSGSAGDVTGRSMLLVGGFLSNATGGGPAEMIVTNRTLVIQLRDDLTWDFVDLAGRATVTLPSNWTLSTAAMTRVAGGTIQASLDGSSFFIYGGSATPSLYTAPAAQALCVQDTGGAAQGMRLLLNQGGATSAAATAACSNTASGAANSINQLENRDGSSAHQDPTSRQSFLFGGTTTSTPVEAANIVMVRDEDAPARCASSWNEIDVNGHAMFDASAGQVSSPVDVTGCRSVECRDFADNESACIANGILECYWTPQTVSLQQFQCLPQVASGPAEGGTFDTVSNGMCGATSGSLGPIDTRLWQSCSEFLSQSSCRLHRAAATGSSLCRWDSQSAVLQLGGIASASVGPPYPLSQWLYVLGSGIWTDVTAPTSPQPQARAYATSVSVNTSHASPLCGGGTDDEKAVILFGGEHWDSSNATLRQLADTWIGCLGRHPLLKVHVLTWTHLTEAGGPSGRSGASMFYDPTSGKVWLFGGKTSSASMGPLGENIVTSDEMWNFDLASRTWTEVNRGAAGGPQGRAYFAHAIVSKGCTGPGHHALIYGGLVSSTSRARTLSASLYAGVQYTATSDMWAFNLATQTWTSCPQKLFDPTSDAWPTTSDYNTTSLGRILTVSGEAGNVFVPDHIENHHLLVVYGGMQVGNGSVVDGQNVDIQPLPFRLDRENIYTYDVSYHSWTSVDVRGIGSVNMRFGYTGTIVTSPTVPSGLSLYLFGGYEGHHFSPIANTRAVLFGCPKGFVQEANSRRCSPCPQGHYVEHLNPNEPLINTTCTSCSPGLTTDGPASTSIAACNVCASNACNGNGKCNVLGGNTGITCSCRVCYRGKLCETNICVIIFPVLLGLGVITAIMVMSYKRAYKPLLSDNTDMTARLLDTVKEADGLRMQRDQLIALYNIDHSEVSMSMVPIATGAQGEVYKGKYNERIVAIKTIAKSRRMFVAAMHTTRV